MSSNKLDELKKERDAVAGFIFRAQSRLSDIDEQIRFYGGGNDPADFSGAVERLRKAGVLPKSQK